MTLTELLDTLPDGALVPVSWVREQLEAQGNTGSLRTVGQVAARLSRSASTIRGWCEDGRFDGAFKLNGRDWRIPAPTIDAFLAGQRPARAPSTPLVQAPRRGKTGTKPKLGAWRQERPGGKAA